MAGLVAFYCSCSGSSCCCCCCCCCRRSVIKTWQGTKCCQRWGCRRRYPGWDEELRRRVKLLPACCVVGLKKRSQKGLNKWKKRQTHKKYETFVIIKTHKHTKQAGYARLGRQHTILSALHALFHWNRYTSEGIILTKFDYTTKLDRVRTNITLHILNIPWKKPHAKFDGYSSCSSWVHIEKFRVDPKTESRYKANKKAYYFTGYLKQTDTLLMRERKRERAGERAGVWEGKSIRSMAYKPGMIIM